MPPRTTIWELDEQTRGKHQVLKAYLEAWYPKLANWSGRVVFIDGFAGPGEYTNGEPGSPIIAINSVLHHSHRPGIKGAVTFVFVEADKKRAEHLGALLENYDGKLPPGWSIKVIHGAFDEQITGMMKFLEGIGKKLAPAFVMVDPFGVSDTPLSVIEAVLKNPRAEVYVSLMYEHINRFKSTPEFEQHLTSLFGCDDWRIALEIDDKDARREFIFSLYENRLRSAGAKHVVKFTLCKEGRLVYAIFFASGSWQGANAMKEAIWKIAPAGDFEFRGSAQFVLGIPNPDLARLQGQLSANFSGKGWVTIDQIQEFVGSDQTDFHLGHVKTGSLKPMEFDGRIEVDPASRKKKGTYPDGTRIRFL